MATGVRIIKAFGRMPLMQKRFEDQARLLRATSLEGIAARSLLWTQLNFLPNLSLVAVLLIGGFNVVQGSLTIGGLVAFMNYVFMLTWPMDAIGWVLSMSEECQTASERLNEVIDSRPEIADHPGARALDRSRGHIELRGVGFKYPKSDEWILRDLNLVIEPGETVGIVGRTGSGKTTLAYLLPRLYDVDEGSVLLDGVDVRELQLRSLRSHIGVAFEDPILFSASVHENLVMGRPIVSDEELKRAIDVAQAGFVWELPWGLETRVGEQGYTLSGGQRQRLALARAVLGGPPVLVLDDPLSSVDVHTEAVIEESLAGVRAELGGGAGVSVEAPVDRWRGVASEEIDEFSPSVAGLLRRRSRRLLFGLAKPYRWEIALAGVLILVRSTAYLALPYLVGLGIDIGIRPGRTGNLRTLVVIVAALLLALVVNAAANYAFLRLSGRIGADILFDLRKALFAHVQELSLSFYERYTSGRIISRLTSDIDALNELLATGLTSVITSVISVVAITVILLHIDVRLGMVTLVAMPLVVG